VDKEPKIMKKHKLLIYSDCYIYGGSEKLISFIIKNRIIQDHYQITFVYRNHKIYQEAINKEYSVEERKILSPLAIASNATFFYKIDLLNIPTIIKKMIKLPFYIIDKSGVFFIYNFLIQIYVLLKFSPDIVHINNGGYPGASSCSTMVFASQLIKKTPVVYQINNSTFKTKSPIQRCLDSCINNYVNCFITASKHAKEKLVHYRKFDADKIIQVLNTILEEPVTISRENLLKNLQIKQTDFVLCNIGFLSKRKGQIYLLEALNLIRIQNPIVFEKICLLLIGNGEEETILKQYADSFNLNKQVHFLGYQTQSVNYLNCCDLFVFPSIAGEDMPLVILSAMNLGKTILATDFAGIREEIEDNKSGILIPLNTETLAKTLTDKIIELYYNKNHKMGENAKLRYQQLFSNSIYGKTILDIYDSLINTKN
jgi:glycosyltransferase involved in cell wall biosynthesis